MTESEVRKLLRQMKELDSQTAFRDFYNMTYDRLFRIAYYYVKQEEWSQEIVLDVFLKLWKQRSNLLDVRNIEDYCFILVKNASLNYLEKESKHTYIHPDSLPEPQEQSYSPEESLISEELFALYVKALDRLPERCREVFIRILEHAKETVDCEGNKSECELEIKIVAMEKAKEDRTVVLAAPPPVTGQAAVIQLTEKKVIIKAGKKSATTIIKIYPKQMVLNKQNVTLSCTPQWKEGGISKLTILLKRK